MTGPTTAAAAGTATPARGARVMLVEDHLLLAQTVASALTRDGLEVLRPERLDPEAVLAAARAYRPDVVLLDLVLGAGTLALPLVAPLVALGARVVIVTGETDRIRLAECVEAGALGVVGKHEPFPYLLDAVDAAVCGRLLLSPARRDALLQELRLARVAESARLAPFERLTPRERDVLRELAAGRPAEVIAHDNRVSVATVRSQIRSVLLKLGVGSQLAAVAQAARSRWPL